MTRYRFNDSVLLITSLFLCFSWAKALAEPIPSDIYSVTSAKLITEYDGVAPDGSLWLGLMINVKSPWHTYWINPGDSGARVKIVIEPISRSAQSLSLSEYISTPPQRIGTGRLATFGYEDRLVVAGRFALPELRAGDRDLELKVVADWLVCASVCVPATKTLHLVVPVKVDQSALKKTADAAVFDQLRLSAATPLPEQSLRMDLKAPDTAVVSIQIPERMQRYRLALTDFFPFPGTNLKNQKPEILAGAKQKDRSISVRMRTKLKDPKLGAAGTRVEGIFRFFDKTSNHAFFWRAGNEPAPFEVLKATVEPLDLKDFLIHLALAVLGGLILNLMPCVFPILSLKVFKVLKANAKERHHIQRENLYYALGCVVSFVSFGLIILGFQEAGAAIGWGFQLQSVPFVAFLSILFFLMALNFLEAYEFPNIPVPFKHKSTHAHIESFFSGVLAVMIASPCTAPFMGASLGYALGRSALEVIGIFTALGIGLALPYILVSYSPPLLKLLPRPGAWMVQLKQFMAFPLILTVIWLLWILHQAADVKVLMAMLVALTFISFFIWLKRGMLSWFLVILVSFAFIFYGDRLSAPKNIGAKVEPALADESEWKPFSEDALAQLQKENAPVFVNFTADWCLTCKVNEYTVFDDREVNAFFIENKIVRLKGDWTRRDPEITLFLKKYGRIGVPMYVFFPSKGSGVVLPELLTKQSLINEIKLNLSGTN